MPDQRNQVRPIRTRSKTEVSGENVTATFVPMSCDLVAPSCAYGDDQDDIPPTPLTVAMGA